MNKCEENFLPQGYAKAAYYDYWISTQTVVAGIVKYMRRHTHK